MQITYSHHLVGLVARVQTASTRLAGTDPDRRALLARRSRSIAAALSTRLDGSPLTEEVVAAVDDGLVPVLAEIPRAGADGVGWARALRLEALETQDVAAVEYANMRALAAVEADLAGAFLANPSDTLRRLHGVICRGLVEPEVIGSHRVTDQAMHDGAQGMVIYNAMAPAEVPAAMADLDVWISRRSLVVPPAVTAGVVHQWLLQIQPFEAANGRVARAATRLVLLASGIDPHGVAVLEAPLWEDPSGYYGEVAATIRRRGDLTRWLERHTAALAVAMEVAADALDPEPMPAPPERGTAVVADVPAGQTITLRDYAEQVGVDLRTAHADLTAFARARHLVDVPGGSGLTFRRPSPTR